MPIARKAVSEYEILSEIDSLSAQIALQESFLTPRLEEGQRHFLQETISRLKKARYRLEKQLSNSLEIKLIAEGSTDDAIDEHRNRQPVKCGQNVYLPIAVNDSVINLPNLLLRSAVFGVTKGGNLLDNQIVGSHKKYIIRMTGCQLNESDRRVFAACLELYQESASSRKSFKRDLLPLASSINGIDDGWNPITYWKLSQSTGRSSGPNVAKAIQASLVRLNSARLQVSWGAEGLPVMPLVEVQFGYGYGYPPSTEDPRLGDTVSFRVLDSLAYLYVLGGPKASTTIDRAGLKTYRQALASWLACYYSSHQRPFTTSIEHLRMYCGATSKPNGFRRQLKNALTEFQSPETPNQFRVSRFELTKTEVTVHLARWKS